MGMTHLSLLFIIQKMRKLAEDVMEGGADLQKKILIVEDNEGISEVLCELLELFGFSVVGVAKCYDDAILLFNRHKPDLVTLDIDLKGDKTGVDVAEYIRNNSDVPFVFLSSTTDAATLKLAKAVEPFAHLLKPIDAETLEKTLRLALVDTFKHH